MKTKLSLLLLLILLIPASLVSAKGRRPDKAIITGPGLTSPIEVTSPRITGTLMAMHVPILDMVENPYTISFFQRDENGELARTPFHAYSYFPNSICERGLVFDPFVSNRWSLSFATPEGEAVIKRLIRSQATSEAPFERAPNADWATWAPWMVAFGVTLANGFVTLGVLRRKEKRGSVASPDGEESAL